MDQNQPNYSVDYLDQIAPKKQRKIRFSRIQIIAIAAAVLIILSTVILFVVVLSNSSVQPEKQLAARLQGTEKIVTDAQKKIQSNQLRTLNSNLKIYLTNANHDIVTPLKNIGIEVSKLDKTLLATESGADVAKRLEDARLQAVFDRTYAREMSSRLNTILILMRKINNSTHSQSLKTFLTGDAYKNLEQSQKQFSEFKQ